MRKVRRMFTADEIAVRVKNIGEKLTADFNGEIPLFVCVLKGASIFFADIIRQVKTDIDIDFITISSYGGNTFSSEMKFIKDLETNVAGRKIVIVEDIIDTGKTIDYLRQIFLKRGAESVSICCLLDKFSRREVEVEVKYIGFEISDEFVVGYGLDYDEKYRNDTEIWVLGE